MSPDDICLAFRFRNEDRFIDRFLRNALPLCRCFVAIDDRSDSLSVYHQLLSHHKCAGIIRKNNFLTHHEDSDRESMYALVVASKLPWMLALDVDEIIERTFIEEMRSIPDQFRAVAFRYIYMHPGDNNHIVRGIYSPGLKKHGLLMRVIPDLCFKMTFEERLHTPRQPIYGVNWTSKGQQEYASSTYVANSWLYHYSMADDDRRKNRHSLYTRLDPNNEYQTVGYDHILKEHEYAPLAPNIIGPEE